MIDPTITEAIAKSDFKNLLFKLLEQVKNEVADIRNGEYSYETRKAVIDTIDNLIVNKIRPMKQQIEKKPDDSAEWK